MAFFFLLILVAVGLGIVGVVGHGLLYLLGLGVAVLLLDFVLLGFRLRRRRPSR